MRARKHAVRVACVAATIAAALPTAASASELGYTYAEARYLDINLANDVQADGLTAIGWYRFSDHFFAIGQIISAEVDTGVDVTTYAVGGGYIFPLNFEWDAIAMATGRRVARDLRGATTADEGYAAQFGFRGMPIPKIETRALVNYVDVGDDATTLFLSGDYFFSPQFCAGVAVELGEENARTVSLGVRYAFGS